MIPTAYKTVKTMAEFEALMIELHSFQVASLDTETYGDFLTGTILSVQFSTKVGTGWVIPFYKTGPEYSEPTERCWTVEENDYIWKMLKSYLENPDKKKVGQNIKYDYQFFHYYNVRLKGIIFDTMLGHSSLMRMLKASMTLGHWQRNILTWGIIQPICQRYWVSLLPKWGRCP